MRQKIQDFTTLLKRDRKTQVIIAVLVCAVMFLMFGESNKFIPTPKRTGGKLASTTRAADEGINDLITALTVQTDSMEKRLGEVVHEVAKNREEGRNFEARSAEIMKRILERLAETEAAVTQASLTTGGTGITAPGGGVEMASGDLGNGDMTEDGIDTIGFEDVVVGPPPPPAIKKIAVVGAGDSVRIKLLAGVHAPTDGTPYPVVFKLLGDVHGPDGSALPLGEARLIAAAQGSLTDSRALFRLSSLNLRLPDGRRKILSVDGWVVGEDGIRGMEGVTIDPLGKAIGGAVMAGGLQGFGQALQNKNTTYTYSIYGTQ